MVLCDGGPTATMNIVIASVVIYTFCTVKDALVHSEYLYTNVRYALHLGTDNSQ